MMDDDDVSPTGCAMLLLQVLLLEVNDANFGLSQEPPTRPFKSFFANVCKDDVMMATNSTDAPCGSIEYCAAMGEVKVKCRMMPLHKIKSWPNKRVVFFPLLCFHSRFSCSFLCW